MNNVKAHIMAAREAGPFKPAVVLGQGLPNDINGEPVAYFWKEMLPVGKWRDWNTGKMYDVDAKRIDNIVRCFNRAKEKGYRPFLPPGHKDRSKNYGFLQDVRVNDKGTLEGLHQFIGADAIRETARNKTSICTLEDITDEHGEHFEELIDHNAVLPDPQLNSLGDFVPFNPALAASRGQTISVDVLELAASTQESEMDISALRKAIGAAETVADAEVIAQAATKIGEIPGIVQAKEAAITTLEATRTELSRRPAVAEGEFPAAIATGSVNNLSREIELMAREGSITGEQATAAKALIGTPEKPNTLMLSRDGANHPAEGWLKVLALGKSGVDATGKAKTCVQELARQSHDHSDAMNLSREDKGTDYAAVAAAAAGKFVAQNYPQAKTA